jgi:hypothetical protein
MRRVRLCVILSQAVAVGMAAPDFSREVRPILSQHCFKCHGPDEQKGGVRFDLRESATAPAKSDAVPIRPGKPDESELLLRVTSPHEDEVMPPRKSGNQPLTGNQIETLRAWIAAGAEYRPHWAYVKPGKAPLPAAKSGAGAPAVHPVDAFIRDRLARENLEPSAPAAAETLVRRLHLDLIGLPPAPADVDVFVEAARRNPKAAVESLADRLLASPRFGEKWARLWLDLARYGDSAGYQHDDEMPLWPYRDWVIRALNTDMPFDRFTVEQIAGDLLPDATMEQRIATGFHRGATATLGADQNVDELRAQLIWDRVNTVGTTWLATSLECAQCHTHKFDPIPHRDYYRLYAYFNRTIPEITKEEGSHYFITGGILELPAPPEVHARVADLKTQMRAEIQAMVATPVELKGAGAPLRRIFNGPPASREPERAYYYLTDELKGAGPAAIAPRIQRLRELGRELMRTRPARSLVLEEDKAPPTTHLLLRGNVRTPGEEVTPGTLSSLHPLPADAPPNRLGLAQWLVSPDNPLTARVIVNRWWAELFGQGLVATPEDFGLQGEFPSHPELLDWLAVDLMEHGWGLKRLLKLLVTSATYAQSSRVTPERLERDPQNRLLARGPRHRLEAELLRDNALAIGGLLEHTLGGPPVQPTPRDAKGAGEPFAFRRGIYLRQQRGDPYATFASFDAPNRFACTARRPRTNTPLQALAVLNEPVFFEAGVQLARRTADSAEPAARIARMFRLAVARTPDAGEVAALARLHAAALGAGADDATAWTLVGNTILNLDETLTKE